VPAELDRAGMDRIVAAFAQATRRAARLGLDLIEIHSAHGYLLSSFLSPLANRRTDAYGGSLDKRMRFPLEVFDAVRAAWPAERPAGVRCNGTDWHASGITPDEAVAYARALRERGCDFVDVSSAGISPAQRVEAKPGLHVPFARAIREATRVPTIVVGLVTEPAHADAIVANGDADLVALARGMLWNPHWPWHAAKALGAKVAVPHQYLRAAPRWK